MTNSLFILMLVWAIRTSDARFRQIQLCETMDKEVFCSTQKHQLWEHILWPDNSCFLQDCRKCYVKKKTFMLTTRNELVESDHLFLNYSKNEKGEADIYECVENGLQCECGVVSCTGDKRFCNKMQCSNDSLCSCTSIRTKITWSIFHKEKWEYNVRAVTIYTCAAKENQTKQRRHLLQTQVEGTEQSLEENTNLDVAIFSKGKVKVKFISPVFIVSEPGTLIIKVDGQEVIATLVVNKLQVSVPNSYLLQETIIKFIFISNSGTLIRGSLKHDNEITCRKIACFFCLESLKQIKCLPDTVQYVVYCILVILTSICILYVKAILTLVFQVMYFVYVACRQIIRLAKGANRMSLVAGSFLGQKSREQMNKMRNALEQFQALQPRRMSSAITGMVLLAVITVASASCTSNQMLHSENIRCKEEADIQDKKCQVYTNAQIILQNLDFSHCLFLQDKNRNTVLFLQTELVAVKCKFQTVRQYFTFPVMLNTLSISVCSQQDLCGWGTHCIHGKKINAFTQESLNAPGLSLCIPPTMNSNCVIWDSNHCSFVRAYLTREFTNSYEVRKLISYSCEHHIKITENSANFSEEIHVKDIGRTKSGITIRVLGAFEKFKTIFQDNHLIINSQNINEAYLEKASKRNRPQTGEIGFVQANASFSQNFIFDPAGITCQAYEEVVQCHLRDSYLTELTKDNSRRLPKPLGYHLMKINGDGSLTSEVLTTAPVVIALEFSGYSIFIKQNVVCPVFADGNYEAKGCFRCEVLATLQFQAMSKCQPGHVQVTTKNLQLATPSVYLDNKRTQISVKFLADKKCIQDTLCLQAADIAKCKDISFCLEDPEINLNFPNFTRTRAFNSQIAGTYFWETLFSFKSFLSVTKIAGFIAIFMVATAVYGVLRTILQK